MTKTDGVIALETDLDKQPCMSCGSLFLDTGWECNDCGYDNIQWYVPGYKPPTEPTP